MANRFFVGDTDDDWDKAANWSATSGGAGGAGVPGVTDDARLDANSPNVTMNSNVEVRRIAGTGFTNTWDWNNFNVEVHIGYTAENIATATLLNIGTLVFDVNGAGTGVLSFGPGDHIYVNVFIDGTSSIDITVKAITGLNCSIFSIRALSSGKMTFDANSKVFNITSNLNVQKFSTGLVEIIDSLGTATWNITGTIVDLADLNAATSDLKNFNLIENNITFTPPSSGILIINNLTIDNTSGNGTTRTFTFNAGSIQCQRLFLIANSILDGDIVITANGAFNIRIFREFDRDTATGISVTLNMGSGLWEYGPVDSGKDWPLIDTISAGTSTLKIYSGINAMSVFQASGQSFNNVIVTSSSSSDTNGGNGGFVDFSTLSFRIDNDFTLQNASGGTDTDTEFKTFDEIIVGGDLFINPNGAQNLIIEQNHRIKVKGNVTLAFTSGGSTLTGTTNEIEMNGIAEQTFDMDGIIYGLQYTLIISNISTSGVIITNSPKLADLDVNAASADINIRFTTSISNIINSLTLTGSGANRVNLRSTILDTQWKLNTLLAQTVDHVDVRDSDATGSVNKIDATDKSNIDSGNNLFWNFAPKKSTTIVYDYNGITKNTKRIVYDYSAFFTKITRVVYDYSGLVKRTKRIVYDYLKRTPDNVRIILNPYAQDSVRLDWSGFVPPVGYEGEFFYAVYIEGEPYEVDIDSDQTWMDIDGLVNLEDILIDVVIQTLFGQRFTFDFASVGDRIKVIFKESSDPNISRYIFFGDAGDGSIDFTKEIGEIVVAESKKDINTGFIPEGS